MRAFFIGFFLTSIVVSGALRAQTIFAPPGAEWYHSMLDPSIGVFHSYYAGDTTLSGISLRRVMRDAEVGPSWGALGLTVSNLSALYLYNNSDTVFVYNYLFNRFTPLYVFNVHDGDTVRLTLLPAEVNTFTGLSAFYPDSTFRFVVDSVRMVLYDTATLKTVYTRLLGTCDSNYLYTYGNDDTLGAYAEQIGGISIGLSPQFLCGVNLVDESYQTQGALRCYNDPELSIKLVTDSCGVPPSTAVTTIKKQEALNIFPNPATTQLILTASYKVRNVIISNLLGQTVLRDEYDTQKVSVDISGLPADIYFIKINGNVVKKFVKEWCAKSF